MRPCACMCCQLPRRGETFTDTQNCESFRVHRVGGAPAACRRPPCAAQAAPASACPAAKAAPVARSPLSAPFDELRLPALGGLLLVHELHGQAPGNADNRSRAGLDNSAAAAWPGRQRVGSADAWHALGVRLQLCSIVQSNAATCRTRNGMKHTRRA